MAPGPWYRGLREKGEHALSSLRRIGCCGRYCGQGGGAAIYQNLDGAFLPTLLWVDTVITGTVRQHGDPVALSPNISSELRSQVGRNVGRGTMGIFRR